MPKPGRSDYLSGMTQVLLSIGHGYAGQATERALGPGWRVLGSSRQPGAAVLWPDDAANALAGATHLISWVAPGAQGDPVLPVIAGLAAPALRWIGYASASSTWGDTGGAWIDDFTPDAPASDRGRARVAAETGWAALAAARGLPLARIRIAAIYGPGRSALDTLRAGTAQRVVKPGHAFNRIHVDDLGRIFAAAARQRLDGPLIAADCEPAPQADVIAFAAELLGLPCPPDTPFDAAVLSPAARSFWSENKRLDPIRLRQDLNLTLACPSYREGLRAILAAGG